MIELNINMDINKKVKYTPNLFRKEHNTKYVSNYSIGEIEPKETLYFEPMKQKEGFNETTVWTVNEIKRVCRDEECGIKIYCSFLRVLPIVDRVNIAQYKGEFEDFVEEDINEVIEDLKKYFNVIFQQENEEYKFITFERKIVDNKNII